MNFDIGRTFLNKKLGWNEKPFSRFVEIWEVSYNVVKHIVKSTKLKNFCCCNVLPLSVKCMATVNNFPFLQMFGEGQQVPIISKYW